MMEFLTVYNYIIDEHRRRHFNSGSQITSNFWQPWKDLHDRREGKQLRKSIFSQFRLEISSKLMMLADRTTSANHSFIYTDKIYSHNPVIMIYAN